jgi:drug/metabolite transporter (DMT)-like permease
MRSADIVRLVVLGAIWGASFIFVRVLAPVIGPIATADARVLLGGLVLVAYAIALRRPSQLARYGVAYVVMGVINSAIPFALFAYAALYLPASYLGILNSSSPMFAALLAVILLGERLTPGKIAGLVAGCAGVMLASGAGPVVPDAHFAWAVAASLGASFCYAAAGIWLKRNAPHVPTVALGGWSQLAAAAVLSPALLSSSFAPPWAALMDPLIALNVLALACVCSAIAYLLYYRLVQDVGPVRTLTVTYLIPLFGMLWASLFLHERITWPMLAGCALIIGGPLAVLRPAGKAPAGSAGEARGA